MPEGDSLHRIARRLQPLVGERVEAESPHPRGAATGVARAVDGRVLEHVGAVGKHLVLRFEGGVVVRSHLRMTGRWRVDPRGRVLRGRPWLVLRGTAWEATQWNGPVLAFGDVPAGRVGPDLLAPETEPSTIVARIRRVDQSRLAGRRARRPAGRRRYREHVARRDALAGAAVSVVSGRRRRQTPSSAERSPGRETRCARRCSMPVRPITSTARREDPVRGAASAIRSRGLGDANRTAYWCPACQPTADSAEREGFEPSTSGLPPVTP